MKKALEGIKVVDLTSALSGPFCTMMLADYGADVLKIEPLHGDQCRTWGPIDEKSGESGFYCYVNRNKKGATLNLKSEKGKQMFYDLAGKSYLYTRWRTSESIGIGKVSRPEDKSNANFTV